jgi:putative aldouronate transport system substrate-binding protein
VGYLEGACGSVRALDTEDPNSLISRLRALNGPEAEIVPGPLPQGPEGKRGAWCWGGGGNILVFGLPTVDRPEKVVRILKLLNELVINEALFVESKVGKQGLHWDYSDPEIGKSSGIRMLPPFDLPQSAKREAIVTSGDLGGGGVFSPNCGDPAIYNKYRRPAAIAYIKTHRLEELRIRDIFMKPDVVPSAGELLSDLLNFQETSFAQIIRGDKDLDYFDHFVEEWYLRGGQRLTEEANHLLAARNRIYEAVGVPGAGEM